MGIMQLYGKFRDHGKGYVNGGLFGENHAVIHFDPAPGNIFQFAFQEFSFQRLQVIDE